MALYGAVVDLVCICFLCQEQVSKHVAPDTLSVYTYHGGNRNRSPEFLASHDIVLTSYNTMTLDGMEAEKGATSKGLFSVHWHRVVLDEAHTIRNKSAKMHKAAMLLSSKFRWGLTGTLIVNRADDAQALLAFLRLKVRVRLFVLCVFGAGQGERGVATLSEVRDVYACVPWTCVFAPFQPYDEFEIWNQMLGTPIREGDPTGLPKLRSILASVSLRRTKALLASQLPPRTVELHRVKLDKKTRKIYNALDKVPVAGVVARTLTPRVAPCWCEIHVGRD